MDDESAGAAPQNNGLNAPQARDSAGASEPRQDRLPPPMFPPGARRRPVSRVQHAAPLGEDDGVPEDAFIMPDEPIRRGGAAAPAEEADAQPWTEGATSFDSALIDPDAPIVRTEAPRTPADYEQVIRGTALPDLEEVVVTGIGESAYAQDEDVQLLAAAGGDAEVAQVIRAVKRLADALATRGEAGLRTSSDMTRFEATLRAYCVGYLAGLRDQSRET